MEGTQVNTWWGMIPLFEKFIGLLFIQSHIPGGHKRKYILYSNDVLLQDHCLHCTSLKL